MGRSFGVVCLFGLISASVAGTYPGFSFLTSETRNYAPSPSSYYSTVGKSPVSSQQETGVSTISRPVVRSLRGAPSYYSHSHSHGHHHDHHDHHHHSPSYYISKELYYPEAAVFSDPLPIVPLPQLPAEFLTLKTSGVNTGAYGGSENEVPKRSSKKGKKAKSKKPKKEEEEEEEDVQETEADEESQGGYSSGPSQRQRQRSRSRQRGQAAEAEEGEVSGGYPSSGQPAPASGRGRSRQREEDASVSGGYPSSMQAPAAEAEEGEVTGGYPSSFDSSSRSRARGNRNKGSDEEEDAETEADAEDDEIMMTGEDAEDDDQDNAAEIEDEEEEEAPKSSKRGKSRNRGNKKSGRSGNRSRGKGSDDDEASALNEALANNGQKIETFYVPTFGNNVLNAVYPAFSQNSLLKSLDAQNQGYPESGMDVSSISITDDEDDSSSSRKKSRKSKKRTSPRRKNRPSSRSRSGRRGNKNRQPSSARAQEPSQQYGAPQGNQAQAEPNQQYGAPNAGFSSGSSQQYGAPAPFRNSGISPPSQNQGGYRTINNELRQSTSDLPQSLANQQQPQQQYGAPASGGRFIEPRQLSQSAVVGGANQGFSSSSGVSPAVTQELIRTVQAILEKYPN